MLRTPKTIAISLALATAVALPTAAATSASSRDTGLAHAANVAATSTTTLRAPASLACTRAGTFRTLTASFVSTSSRPSQYAYQRMTIYRSYDNGRTWNDVRIIRFADGTEWMVQSSTGTASAQWRTLNNQGPYTTITDVVVDYSGTHYAVKYEILWGSDARTETVWGPVQYC